MARLPLRYRLRTLVEVPSFKGGLNLLAAPSELADDETPYCINVTLDERGGVEKRLGRTRKNLSGALPGTPSDVYYWPSAAITIFQVGATVYKTTDDFGTWTAIATMSTTARMAFTDFNGKLVGVHKADGVFTYDGVTWSLGSATVKGTCIASWQNKVYVGGDPSNPSRVWWSNAGNPAVYTTGTDFNDLREKDDKPITALGIGQGMDVAGRPGLLVFKEDSAYRINSSSTGSYTTIDASVGAAGPLAITTQFGIVAVLGKSGIFTTDAAGLNELKPVSDKISPMFRDTQLNFALQDLWCAGVYRDRMVFSIPWGSGQAYNNRTLEYSPLDGWIVPHDFGAASFTTYAKQGSKLYAASPNAAYVYEQFKSGADDGAAITSHYQTRWIVPGSGKEHAFRHARVFGRGAFDLYARLDYAQGQGELFPVSLLGSVGLWNTHNWNDGSVWGPSVYEDVQDFFSFGRGKAISFEFVHTGTASATGPALLADGTSPEVGAFACYGLELDCVYDEL